MKTKNILISLIIGAGLLTSSLLLAQGGKGNRNGAPSDAPASPAPETCPNLVDGVCPGPQSGAPEDCPCAIDGVCPGLGNPENCPRGESGACGPRQNPECQPKQDGTGGSGKPTNPACPQDGSGRGRRG